MSIVFHSAAWLTDRYYTKSLTDYSMVSFFNIAVLINNKFNTFTIFYNLVSKTLKIIRMFISKVVSWLPLNKLSLFLMHCPANRWIFKINPDNGSKVEKQEKKRIAVNPRVQSLISKISEFDWSEWLAYYFILCCTLKPVIRWKTFSEVATQ